MEEALKAQQLPYERFERPELLERVAQLLNGGKVLGWYQGGASGARGRWAIAQSWRIRVGRA